jgi:hypothetical protein
MSWPFKKTHAIILTAHVTGKNMSRGIPLVMLINSESAAASKIAVGCLQNFHRTIIIGRRNFEKGSIQRIIFLENGGAIKLTSFLYHTPEANHPLAITHKKAVNKIIDFNAQTEKRIAEKDHQNTFILKSILNNKNTTKYYKERKKQHV